MVHTHGVRGSIPFSATEIKPLSYEPKGFLSSTGKRDCIMRIGTGYDVHRLVEDRDLIIGGVKIPYEKGLLGHSDADVLLHAIMDALLGAAALGDIGKHFPDSDEKYKGASSIMLMEQVRKILEDNNYIIENVDSTIIAQKPKLASYIEEMRNNIAKALEIDVSRVSVKATTEEGLGFTGDGQGIAVQASALIDTVANMVYDDIMNDRTACEGCKGCCNFKG